MPGRNKASSSCSRPELAVGQQAGEGSRDARGRSPHGEDEERGEIRPGTNLGDPDIVKSPSDPKQYRPGPGSPVPEVLTLTCETRPKS